MSKKYQVVIPEKLRREAGIKPGDKMVAISKHKILHYIPLRSLKESKGTIPRLTTEELRDENDRE